MKTNRIEDELKNPINLCKRHKKHSDQRNSQEYGEILYDFLDLTQPNPAIYIEEDVPKTSHPNAVPFIQITHLKATPL